MLAVMPGPTDELRLNFAWLPPPACPTSWLMFGVLMTLPYRVEFTNGSSSAEAILGGDGIATEQPGSQRNLAGGSTEDAGAVL